MPKSLYTADALRAAVAQGGRIVLPAGCTIDLGNKRLTLVSNTIIEGHGDLTSGIRVTDVRGLVIHGVENVVLRNLTIDGGDTNAILVDVDLGSRNLLLERLHLKNVINKTIGGVEAEQVTIRYNWMHHTRDYHGVGIDALYENVAIYSNYTHDIGYETPGDAYGIDSHATQSEVAGNYIVDADSGMKFPDGEYIVVHHNLIERCTNFRGIRTYRDTGSPNGGRAPRNHIYFANRIDTGTTTWSGNSRMLAFSFTNADEVYLAGNYFGTVPPYIGRASSTVFTCAGTEEASFSAAGVKLKATSGGDRTIAFPPAAGFGTVAPCLLPAETTATGNCP